MLYPGRIGVVHSTLAWVARDRCCLEFANRIYFGRTTRRLRFVEYRRLALLRAARFTIGLAGAVGHRSKPTAASPGRSRSRRLAYVICDMCLQTNSLARSNLGSRAPGARNMAPALPTARRPAMRASRARPVRRPRRRTGPRPACALPAALENGRGRHAPFPGEPLIPVLERIADNTAAMREALRSTEVNRQEPEGLAAVSFQFSTQAG